MIRIGFIGLAPRCFGKVEYYGWEYHPKGIVSQTPNQFPWQCGRASTLREAKRKVEAAYKAHLEDQARAGRTDQANAVSAEE